MKKTIYKSILIILFSFIFINLYAQRTKYNPFQMVNVPDSISLKLDIEYKKITGFDSVNAGKNVWNLLDGKDFEFKNGIYSYKGQGPHFPRLIFIFNNDQLYIFRSFGANNPKKVIEEYVNFITYLDLQNNTMIAYLLAISQYLEEELDSKK